MFQYIVFCVVLIVLSLNCLADIIDVSNTQAAILAPGYGPLTFTAPEAGNYQLPILGKAGDGEVIDTDGHQYTLNQLMLNKVIVLSFIYSTCNDMNGCPLATSVLNRVKTRLNQESKLASQIRLLTLSFNPEFDTPEVMKHYAQGFQDGDLDWRFLTTQSEQQLQPILEKYQQTRQKQYDENGHFTGAYSHLLRVYLIDRQIQLRNIYSVSFLHADTLINDIRTLLMEQPGLKTAGESGIPDPRNLKFLYGAGDE